MRAMPAARSTVCLSVRLAVKPISTAFAQPRPKSLLKNYIWAAVSGIRLQNFHQDSPYPAGTPSSCFKFFVRIPEISPAKPVFQQALRSVKPKKSRHFVLQRAGFCVKIEGR